MTLNLVNNPDFVEAEHGVSNGYAWSIGYLKDNQDKWTLYARPIGNLTAHTAYCTIDRMPLPNFIDAKVSYLPSLILWHKDKA